METDHRTLRQPAPDHGRNWHLRLERDRLTAIAAFPSGEVLAFKPQQFGLPALA